MVDGLNATERKLKESGTNARRRSIVMSLGFYFFIFFFLSLKKNEEENNNKRTFSPSLSFTLLSESIGKVEMRSFLFGAKYLTLMRDKKQQQRIEWQLLFGIHYSENVYTHTHNRAMDGSV